MIGGPDIKKLEQYAKSIMADLRKVPGAVDVDSSLSLGKPQYGIARRSRPRRPQLGVSIADIANTLRLLVAGDKVSDYNEKGEQYEVHVRSIADVRNRLDELKMVTVPSNKYEHGSLGRRGALREGHRPGPDQPSGPHAAGHDQRQPGARHVAADGAGRDRPSAAKAEHGARVHHRPAGQVEGNGQDVPGVRHGLHLGLHLRLPVHRRAVRVVAASDHDPAVAALDPAVRAGLAADLPPVAQYLFAPGHSRAVRRGEEELDLADRPHQSASRRRHVASSRRSSPPTATGCARS